MTIAMDLSYWPDTGVWEFLLNLVLLSFTSSETTARLGKYIPATPYNEHFLWTIICLQDWHCGFLFCCFHEAHYARTLPKDFTFKLKGNDSRVRQGLGFRIQGCTGSTCMNQRSRVLETTRLLEYVLTPAFITRLHCKEAKWASQ